MGAEAAVYLCSGAGAREPDTAPMRARVWAEPIAARLALAIQIVA